MRATLRKIDIIRHLSRKTTFLSRKDVKLLIELFFETIVNDLKRDSFVKLTGFGCFSLYTRAQCMGRNPKTGTGAVIHKRNVIRFKKGKFLKKIVVE